MSDNLARRPFIVRLKRTFNGEERDYRDEFGRFDNEGAWQYLWTEGNYGCDCNRALFFYNWGPESDNHRCGTVAFQIVRITDEATGEVICEGEP